jgi:4-amino-4-deoxy-L-arabinose transferase-like glycosyltransferase
MHTTVDISRPCATAIAAVPTAAPWRGGMVWLFAIAWFAATAWLRPLAMPDEGRYLSVAWEMLSSGNWLVPTLDGLPFFHKPPLFYWMANVAMQLGGATPFAGRIPSILAAGTLAWAMHSFDRRWSGARHASLLLIVLVTTPYVYLAAQYANMDMLVAACISISVLCAAHAAIRMIEGREPGVALHGAYAMAALGVLAKGLIGCVLPAGIVIAWLLVARRASLLRRLVSPIGFAIFIAIALPWPVAMQARYPGFFHYFIVEQHLNRFAGSGFNNAQGWWFYVPVMFLMTMPWSLGIVSVWRQFAMREQGTRGALRLLMICWAVVVVVFFSVPESKLLGYALPAAPPIVWLLADGLDAASPVNFLRRHAHSVASASCILLLAVVLAYGARAPHSSHPLAVALAGQRSASESVVFFDTYPYDLEFDMQLKPPIVVVQAWRDPSIAQRDSWHRELLDEARFAPEEAATRLIEEVPANAGWIVSPSTTRLPSGVDAVAIARTSELTLWKVRQVKKETGP